MVTRCSSSDVHSDYSIRAASREDLPALESLLSQIELFPPEMLSGMMADYLDNPSSAAHWPVVLHNEAPVALCYCDEETLTEGTYNLYAIGIHPDHQGEGIGSVLVSHVISTLESLGARLLIVDTSGLPEYEGARAFYQSLGFQEVACIPEYWAPGDDKITYSKKLDT